MDFKKVTLAAILAVSQAGAAIPAFAEPVSTATASAGVQAAQTSATPSPTSVSEPLATDPLPSLAPDGSVLPAATPDPNATMVPNATTDPNATIDPNAVSPSATAQPTSTQAVPGVTTLTTSAAGANQLILHMNSNKMFRNGEPYFANQPMAVKNGVSYVSIRAIMEMLRLSYIYDAKTKEVVLTKDNKVMRFKTDSKIYTVNGVPSTMKGPAYQFKGTFMVPLTSITAALNIPYTVDNIGKRVILTLNTKPTASFKVQTGEIFAGDYVTFTPTYSSPNGTAIVKEVWGGDKRDIYDQPGTYAVSYSVIDASGLQSDPYWVTINVLQPNLPPVANFTTDKEEYMMGEPITFTDLSSDPEYEELTAEWSNRAIAFFNPGPVQVSLTVTDKHGLSNTFSKTINITSQQLYTQDEVAKLFTAPGDVVYYDGGMIPGLTNVNNTVTSEPYTLIRSNSPETVNTEGILYRESSVGLTRFLVHHMNNMNTRQKLYVIATNNNLYPTTITTQYAGIAGPVTSPEYTGKISIQKYFNSMITNEKYSSIVLQPGQSVPILTDISKIAMKPKEVLSLSADLFSDLTVQYNVVMVEENKDPIAAMATLPILDRDGVHNRGTYPDSTRIITVSDTVGATQSKLVLGDNDKDKNLIGVDPMNGTEASNSGNFGVLYKIKLERVAPNTLITFNPRGGNYLGSIMVNGNTIVNLPNKGSLSNSDMNAVVYRSGDYEGPVEFTFSVASGSNLPVNLVFTPMPAKKH
ncbi:copper amine oxidase N-terminal domain-containing protein [Paenibacillus tepidiphilus]|uniref:copper amine oxidase N-terminal domain-containing protein n=1 Tax=Paenibacillus tepidiphilus TaxID=2608683 RepID=UPI001238821F|nr:copper amine oxidase N-terminal domain-containing protein [Paenibacillus tepidiphilus]